MQKYILVTLECAGKSITIGTGGDLALLGISGIAAAEFDVDIESNGTLDGGYVSGARISQRTITVATYTGFEESDVLRDRLIHMLRPHDDVVVNICRNGVTRWINGRILELRIEEENMYRPAQVTITIVCPQPWFRDPDDFGQDIAQHVDNVVMPFVIPPEGFVVGTLGQRSIVNLTNSGDVACGLRARVEIKGAVTSPSIVNTGTGEFIKLLGSFSAGDVIEISTEPRAKAVRLNGVNIMHRLDRASAFFGLAVGENTVRYTADDGYNNMAMYIFYTPLYLGV